MRTIVIKPLLSYGFTLLTILIIIIIIREQLIFNTFYIILN